MMKISPKMICILSGHYPGSSFNSIMNHRAYADVHGYCYINCAWPTKEDNPYFNKLRFIQEYYLSFDYIFWIDDDAFFWNFSRKIEDFIPKEGKFFSACRSPSFKKLFTYLSSGQFFIKCNEEGREFIDAVLETKQDEVKKSWTKDLGFFTNGDQDCIVYQLKNYYKDKYELYDYKLFNSRVENLQGLDPHDVFLLHFTGPKPKKYSDYLWVQDKFKLNNSLVEPPYLNQYKQVHFQTKKHRENLKKRMLNAFRFR